MLSRVANLQFLEFNEALKFISRIKNRLQHLNKNVRNNDIVNNEARIPDYSWMLQFASSFKTKNNS